MSITGGSGSVTDISIQGKVIYTVAISGKISAVDVTFPKDPLVVGTLTIGGAFFACCWTFQDRLYCGDSNNGLLYAIDITDPTAMVNLWNIAVSRPPFGPKHIWSDGPYVYLGDCEDLSAGGATHINNQLVVVDTKTQAVVARLTGVAGANDLETIFGAGTFLAMSGASGTSLVDISDPKSPSIAATDSTICYRTFVKGQHLYGVTLDGSTTLKDFVIGGFVCNAGEFGALRSDIADVDHLRGRRADFAMDVTARAFRGPIYAYNKAVDPTTSDIDVDQTVVWTNSSIPETRIWINQAGVLKKSAPFT